MVVLKVDAAPERFAAHATSVPSAFVFLDHCEILEAKEDVSRPGNKRARVQIHDRASLESMNEVARECLKAWFDVDQTRDQEVITVRMSRDVLNNRVSSKSGSVLTNVPDDSDVRSMWVSLQRGNDHTVGDEFQSLTWECVSIVTFSLS
jgi:hypothetical protein